MESSSDEVFLFTLTWLHPASARFSVSPVRDHCLLLLPIGPTSSARVACASLLTFHPNTRSQIMRQSFYCESADHGCQGEVGRLSGIENISPPKPRPPRPSAPPTSRCVMPYRKREKDHDDNTARNNHVAISRVPRGSIQPSKVIPTG